MTLTTLVIGASAAVREAAIAAALPPGVPSAVILEGLPDGKSMSALPDAAALQQFIRIAPGCICCTGSLTMRVTLNRVLRQKPQRLFISLADARHLAEIRHFLCTSPYERLLMLTEDMRIPP
jgi:hypothetical protein